MGEGAGRAGRSPRGFTLVELLAVLALVAVIAALTAAPLWRASRNLRLRTAAAEVCRTLRLARSTAVRQAARVGVKFRVEARTGAVTWRLYRDGDGDGVLSRDIADGTDPPVAVGVGGDGRLAHFGRGVRFGFPPEVPPRPGSSRPLDRLDDAIRFNRSDIASFDPLGSATPGSLYLTDGESGAACVRVSSRAGRIRVLFYDADAGEWR